MAFETQRSLPELVESGRLGRKTGHGWYRHDERGTKDEHDNISEHDNMAEEIRWTCP
jgi:3-hydroxyacyl-CoA dehydrogenase